MSPEDAAIMVIRVGQRAARAYAIADESAFIRASIHADNKSFYGISFVGQLTAKLRVVQRLGLDQHPHVIY